MLTQYVPVLLLFALAALFAIGSVAAGAVIGPKRYNRAKLDAYECGIETDVSAITQARFPIKFYLTAMIFIVFDIEIIFMYPWAVLINVASGYFLLVEMLLFIATVAVAYSYVWKRGGLEWD